MTITRHSARTLKKGKDYDLKKSEEAIGHLYPVLTDSKGRIIDGMHRLAADKDWPKHVVNINDEKSFLIARIVANVQRSARAKKRKTLPEGWPKVCEVCGLKKPATQCKFCKKYVCIKCYFPGRSGNIDIPRKCCGREDTE